MHRPSVLQGIRDVAALAPPLFAFGVLFGVLAVDVGMAPWLAVAASLIVLSGAAQFALVGLLPAGAGAVLVAVTGLALRHVPMSAALARLLPAGVGRRRRLALAYVLVDETFGLTVIAARRPGVVIADYKTGADVVLVVNWLIGTTLGAVLGRLVDPTRFGVGELFPLMFLGLAAPLVRGRRAWITAVAAAVAAVAAVTVLPEAWRVTGAAVAAALVGSRVRE